MKPNFLLTFILGLYLSLTPSLSSANSSPTQLPEGLPASLYNTLVVASGETFVTNDGLLFLYSKDSSIATQFDAHWQEQSRRAYDARQNDRAGKTVINLGDSTSARWVQHLLTNLGKVSLSVMPAPTDPRLLVEAHHNAHFWALASDEKSYREEFSALLKTNSAPYSPFFGKPINVMLREWSEEKEEQEKTNAPRKPFNLLHAAFLAEDHVLAELAAIKCVGNIPLHFGFSRWSKEFNPELLGRISPSLLIKLLNVVRGARGGDIKWLLQLVQAWRVKTQYAEFDAEILPHFPFEKVPPELAEVVEAAFYSYLEPKKEEMSAFLRSPVAARERPAEVATIDAVFSTGTVGDAYVTIEPGEFMMGSPDTEVGRTSDEVQHRVRLTTAYALKATPVTEKGWRELMGNNPSSQFKNRPAGELADECPVQQVSWFDAVAYCNKLSLQERLAPYYVVSDETGTPGAGNYSFASYVVNPTDKSGYRLPTEAEWEHAARGGSAGAMYVANELHDTIAWSWSNSGDRTHPVGKLAANSHDLYDMLGNVYEWTGDYYWGDLSVANQIDPQGAPTGRYRVYRGGAYYSSLDYVRAALRFSAEPSFRDHCLGFRPARSLQN